ncbi:MAG: FAD synthetase family protein [Oscillospiraceae bacterium]|nr:FAD synthetase family protein [Oscillospiraceae bacterium]
MRIIHSMQDWDAPGSVAALGTFDGVHIGHAQLIREAVRLAEDFSVPSAALTFDRHPLSLIRPEAVPKALTSPEEKRARLAALGLDALIEHPFTPEFAALSPDEFFSLLYESLHPRALVVGFNYTFGRKGAGDAGLLSYLCREKGVLCRVMDPVCVDGRPVSSSRIRALIRDGNEAEAQALLGRSEDSKNLK